MKVDPFAGFALRPRDVAEWEDLLVRFELGPRAVRGLLDEGADGLSGDAGRQAAELLAGLEAREAAAARWLQALAEGAAPEPWARAQDLPDPDRAADPGEALRRLDGYGALRARNFARVQRRGLEVWEWRAAEPAFGTVSAFQLVSYLVQNDGRQLARLRDALRAGTPC